MRPPRRSFCSPVAIFFFLAILAAPAFLRAQGLEQAARELAQKILAGASEHPVIALSAQNLSSLGVAQVVKVQGEIEREFERQGARLGSLPAATVEVHVTFSENFRGYLWVAEIRRGGTQQVVMIAVPRSVLEQVRTPAHRLNQQRIWQQSEPILDFAAVDYPSGSTPRLLVLEPGRIVVYNLRNSQWQLQQALGLPRWGPWPRDPRGRLLVERKDVFSAFFPGGLCDGNAAAPGELLCRQDREPWIFRAGESGGARAPLVSGRNLFEKLTLVGPPSQIDVRFFSAAGIDVHPGVQWMIAGLEGRTLLYEDSSVPSAAFSGWGSDLASIETDCDDRMKILATRPGDWTQTDAVQAFEIVERQPVAVSDSTEFPGPVLALWQAQDPRVANAVVRNLKTGQYEAYSLSISCSH